MEKKKKLSTLEEKALIKEHEEEIERATILMKADEIKEETFDFNFDNGQVEVKNELDKLLPEDIDDPEAKFNLYYKVINRLLRKYLPKGKDNMDARKLIYEEKNTFLTRGKRIRKDGIRGMDGRMAYIADMGEFVDIIKEWVSKRGTMFELYTKLRDLNKSKGYGISDIEH